MGEAMNKPELRLVGQWQPSEKPASYFRPDAPEDRNVRILCAGLAKRNIAHETEVWLQSQSGSHGRIDIVSELDGKLYGWEVKQYVLGGPKLIADGIAQAADYARAEIASGTWQGRRLEFVFVGPTPNDKVTDYRFVHAPMLSRYTASLGVGTFDQQMGVYAFGADAIKFEPDGFRFCFRFDNVAKHKSEFRR